MYLQIAKTWLGYIDLKCFGYKVRDGQYFVDKDRSDAFDVVSFSEGNTAQTITSIRSFLGHTQIC